jgi:enoyl-CoA hydratase
MAEDHGLKVSSDGAVATVRIDRPEVRNALTDEVLRGLAAELARLDADPDVRCVVLAGSEKVFASGADLRALRDRDAVQVYAGERAAAWASIRRLETPLVAAVSGFCLGGGLELAMSADLLVASETARFGLPETGLGLIPGAGGTQLLTRAVGRAVAMDVVLSGRLLDADEAERLGLVSRLAPEGAWLETAQKLAATVAARPAVAQRLARESVELAFETGLRAGIDAERRGFAIAFASDDAREGIDAFLAKRDPEWSHGR